MRVRTYLVLRNGRQGVRVARATFKRPYLGVDEAMLRLELQLPDDLFVAPVFTVEIPIEQAAVGIEVEDIDRDGGES